ncbi:uncharacterized protein N7503_004300 [Penicillium pulvis]|uniref:uncharacterized protein n=1 Tax=Penicillium pulvis TaxID=1562058 RepID=UPI002546AD91|nr:uncharacterized protein N7503_004300 [Penicillium pulvis]KAJ5801850.1 hypothetical protein N7503_004300 [Penicillium pulvis]
MARLSPLGAKPSSVQSASSELDACAQWSSDRLKTGRADRLKEVLVPQSKNNCQSSMIKSSHGQVDISEFSNTKQKPKNKVNLAICAQRSNTQNRKRKVEEDGDTPWQT